MGCFVGFVDGEPQAFAVVLLPTTPFMMFPQIVLVYNAGAQGLAVAVGDKMREWLLNHGCEEALSLRRDDPHAFMRATRHFGTPRLYGSLISYKLGCR